MVQLGHVVFHVGVAVSAIFKGRQVKGHDLFPIFYDSEWTVYL